MWLIKQLLIWANSVDVGCVSAIFIFNQALKAFDCYYINIIILYKNYIPKGLDHWAHFKITKEERKEEEKVICVFLEWWPYIDL